MNMQEQLAELMSVVKQQSEAINSLQVLATNKRKTSQPIEPSKVAFAAMVESTDKYGDCVKILIGDKQSVASGKGKLWSKGVRSWETVLQPKNLVALIQALDAAGVHVDVDGLSKALASYQAPKAPRKAKHLKTPAKKSDKAIAKAFAKPSKGKASGKALNSAIECVINRNYTETTLATAESLREQITDAVASGMEVDEELFELLVEWIDSAEEALTN